MCQQPMPLPQPCTVQRTQPLHIPPPPHYPSSTCLPGHISASQPQSSTPCTMHHTMMCSAPLPLRSPCAPPAPPPAQAFCCCAHGSGRPLSCCTSCPSGTPLPTPSLTSRYTASNMGLPYTLASFLKENRAHAFHCASGRLAMCSRSHKRSCRGVCGGGACGCGW